MGRTAEQVVAPPVRKDLPRHPGKDHWSIPDCFRANSPLPVRAFVHRSYEMGLHTHDFIEVNLVLRGAGRHYMSGFEFETRQGDVFVIPPTVGHGYVKAGDLDVFHLLLHPLFVQEHAAQFAGLSGFMMLFTVEPYFRRLRGFRHSLRLAGDDFDLAQRLADLLVRETAADTPDKELALEALSVYLIVTVCRGYSAHQDVSPADGTETGGMHPHGLAIQRVIERVSRSPGARLTLDDLARTASMQKNYFCKVFKAATGLTPMEYVLQQRVQEARLLLKNTDMPVTEIGSTLGFFDTAHFSRSFKQLTGLAPMQFRKKAGWRSERS